MNNTTTLPKPPSCTRWQVHGTPSEPWVWSIELMWLLDVDGLPRTATWLGLATSGDAYAILVAVAPAAAR